MACYKLFSLGFLLALVFSGFASAVNFQSVYVSNGTDEFYNLTLVGCTTDAICADVFNQSFTSASNRTGAYVIVELGENTTYNDDYYFSAYIDNKLLYNRTRTYAGRGNITAAMVWTAAPNNGDTTHLTTAGGVYTWVTGLGYLSAESDPQVDTVNFGDVCQGDGGGNVDCDLNTDGSGDCSSGAVCLGGHDHSGYLTAESDPQVGALTDTKWCKASGSEVVCTFDAPGADANVFLNISALQGNVTDLWTNASTQSGELVALWLNASVQSAQQVLLWSNASAQETHIGNLWGNASDQQTKLNFLMLNASNQDARILTLEGRPLQPSIDAANVTSGTMLNARMNATWLITSDECTAGQFYLYGTGCVVAPAAQPNIDAANITAGTILNARYNISFFAANYLNKTGELNDGKGCQYVSAKGTIDCTETYQESAQPNIDAANVTSGVLVNARWWNQTLLNGIYLNNSGTLTNTKVCTYNSAIGTIDCNSDPSSYNDAWAVNNISSLWTNASNQDARIITLEGLGPANANNITQLWGNLSSTVNNVTGLRGNLSEVVNNITSLRGNVSTAVVNISALQGNASAAVVNITALQGNVTDLWTNASTQSAQQVALWGNASIQETHIRNLGVNITLLQNNDTGQQTSLNSLWSNASNQDGRIISLEGRPTQPSIDASNVTSGVFVNARYNTTGYLVPYSGASFGVNLGAKDLSTTGNVNATVFRMGTFCIRWLNATHVTQEPVCGV